jgi:hypothetical protein
MIAKRYASSSPSLYASSFGLLQPHLLSQQNRIWMLLCKAALMSSNVQIIIYNHDKNGRSLRDPEISNAQILQGVLTYSTIDPEDSFKYKNEFEESYEESLKALHDPSQDTL